MTQPLTPVQFVNAKTHLAAKLRELMSQLNITQVEFVQRLYDAHKDGRTTVAVSAACVGNYLSRMSLPTKARRDAMAVILRCDPQVLVPDELITEHRQRRVKVPRHTTARVERSPMGLKYGRLVIDADLPLAEATRLAEEILGRVKQ
jgi:hypothetical protein